MYDIPNNLPHFDDAEASSRFKGNEDFLQQLRAEFIKTSVPMQMEKIRTAVESGDPEMLVKGAHSLKGACATVAASAAREFSFALEKAGREGDMNAAKAFLKRLEDELEELKKILQE